MKNNKIVLSSLASMVLLSACGGGSSSSETGSNIFFNETRTIPERNYVTVPLPTGSYKAEISASNNGVTVEWVGGTNCANSGETKAYSGFCNMSQKGQIVITNPSVLGLGGDEITTIKIIRN